MEQRDQQEHRASERRDLERNGALRILERDRRHQQVESGLEQEVGAPLLPRELIGRLMTAPAPRRRAISSIRLRTAARRSAGSPSHSVTANAQTRG